MTATKTKVHFADSYIINPNHPISINLVGVGGTGSQVLSGLGRISHALQTFGHPGLYVTAFDPDQVSEANIGRQLFARTEIGLNKADVLITRFNRFFGTAWESVSERYNSEPANIIITCVDNIKSRLAISTSLNHYNKTNHVEWQPKYWLDFGNATNHGQYVLSTVGKIKQPTSKKYKAVNRLRPVTELFDFTQIHEEDSGPSCSLAEALEKQDLFINSSLAISGCSLLWQLLKQGVIDKQGGFLNLSTMQTNPILL